MTTTSTPAWPWTALARVAPTLSAVARRLPTQPPSWAAAQFLTQRWWPLVSPEIQARLCGRRVDVVVTDLGVTLHLRATPGGLVVAQPSEPVAVRLQAEARAFIDLMQGRDDPDTLFFEQRLVMEGDTAYALLLKNTLDAIGPVEWRPWRPAARV